MPARPVIIDCDPGQDDAINLLLAFASPEDFDILGVTVVAGNVPLDMGERNARIIRELSAREDVAVYAGCPRPMVRELITAHYVHGDTGINGMALFKPKRPLASGHAVDFIVETLLASDDASVTLVPTGPLTNIAMALVKTPDILPKIKEIVLMGGAMREGGNSSPSAEFNIMVDPHAAHVVLSCGRPITVIGLDTTHQVLCTQERLDRLKAPGGPVAEAVYGMLSFFNRHDTEKYGVYGAPLHDPCTCAYLLKPDLFEGKNCNVEVEIGSPLTMGHTAVDFWGVTDRPKNVTWLHTVDADGFFGLITDRISRLCGPSKTAPPSKGAKKSAKRM